MINSFTFMGRITSEPILDHPEGQGFTAAFHLNVPAGGGETAWVYCFWRGKNAQKKAYLLEFGAEIVAEGRLGPRESNGPGPIIVNLRSLSVVEEFIVDEREEVGDAA